MCLEDWHRGLNTLIENFVCSVTSVVSNSFSTPWTVARQAPLSMGFFRQEYWSGVPFSPPGDLPNPGIEPVAPDSLPLSHQGSIMR